MNNHAYCFIHSMAGVHPLWLGLLSHVIRRRERFGCGRVVEQRRLGRASVFSIFRSTWLHEDDSDCDSDGDPAALDGSHAAVIPDELRNFFDDYRHEHYPFGLPLNSLRRSRQWGWTPPALLEHSERAVQRRERGYAPLSALTGINDAVCGTGVYGATGGTIWLTGTARSSLRRLPCQRLHKKSRPSTTKGTRIKGSGDTRVACPRAARQKCFKNDRCLPARAARRIARRRAVARKKDFAQDFPERAKPVAFYRIGSTHGRSK
ncbi:hypothetical protein [Burkholderia metallica]|uniref:hypothetical protein n=1 Tax=Burkholderia metallica TaxID=488729 RepID=UPI0012F4CE8A|nr:hypothetical protein [Burkholderia metallica]VWB18022.1 hypothetical protein BME24068_00668 [Burkholderia metallica]